MPQCNGTPCLSEEYQFAEYQQTDILQVLHFCPLIPEKVGLYMMSSVQYGSNCIEDN